MNKDAILATLIGFGIGLLITGLLILAPSFMDKMPKIHLPTFSFQTNAPQSGTTPVPTPEELTLKVESPLAEEILHNNSLLVSGQSIPGSLVIIAGFSDEIMVTPDNDGKFAGKITLVEGKNDLTVTSVDRDKQYNQLITVYYTPEEL